MNIDNKKLTIPVFVIFAVLSIGLSVWQIQESFRTYTTIGALTSSATTIFSIALYIAMLWRIFFVVQDHLLRKVTLVCTILSIIHLLLSVTFYSEITKKINTELNALQQQPFPSNETLTTESQKTH